MMTQLLLHSPVEITNLIYTLKLAIYYMVHAYINDKGVTRHKLCIINKSEFMAVFNRF